MLPFASEASVELIASAEDARTHLGCCFHSQALLLTRRAFQSLSIDCLHGKEIIAGA